MVPTKGVEKSVCGAVLQGTSSPVGPYQVLDAGWPQPVDGTGTEKDGLPILGMVLLLVALGGVGRGGK